MKATLEQIEESILAAANLLPRQGPITKFAFLNPLQGLEHIYFDEVMQQVGALYGNEAYLDDLRYREKLRRGRITESDLTDVLSEDLGSNADAIVAGLTPRLKFRLTMLLYPLHFGHYRELDWVLAESDSLQKFRPEVMSEIKHKLVDDNRLWTIHFRHPDAIATVADYMDWPSQNREQVTPEILARNVSASQWETLYLRMLWRVIKQGVIASSFGTEACSSTTKENATKHDSAKPVSAEFPSHALEKTAGTPGADQNNPFCVATSNPKVDELMIRFTAAFLDQGYAATPLHGVQQGYWNCFRLLYSLPSLMAPRWRRSLASELSELHRLGWSPLEIIQASLERLEIPPERTQDFLSAVLLSLRGFAGMLWQTETRPDLFQKASPPGTLMEFLAVRLLLLRLAHEQRDHAKNSPGEDTLAYSPRQAREQIDPEQMAFLLFELAQMLQWTPATLHKLNTSQWQELTNELHVFCDHQRRRIFHAAFERGIAKMALRSVLARVKTPEIRPRTPSLQVVCCIDAREESLRRHLEELDPDVETFGIAGFFGVAMYYRGVGDADFSALCPIVMKPRHWVIEEAVYSLRESNRSRAQARRYLGSAQRRLQVESQGSLGGALVSTLLGPLATIPMLSRILLPRLTAMMHHTARQFIAPPSFTRLRLERSPEHPPAPPVPGMEGEARDAGIGFTLAEMTDMAERALRDIGLTTNFAPLVILLGHGSSCINNPHESAYHCGACAGNAGGPNARALAAMLNDLRVRRVLASRGIEIPEETYFIGGQHNTATEEMMFHDLELLPVRQYKQVHAASLLLAEAARRNAHERCRRFESADLDLSLDEALLHVQNRSEDLAETRPEYGNGSNAICFVGRRSRIRGLYLDRRSFLMSYDATQDTPEASNLMNILSAVVPVCQGINLLYSLSAIDPGGWGSGTKLPHNITSLLGVMDGAASDLRPGLPWQGVDIHEPVRLLFIIETTPQILLKIMDENPLIGRIIRNHWSHLATLDPHTAKMYRFSKDRFVPYAPDLDETAPLGVPTAEGSREWYQGRREHLPFAIISPHPDKRTPSDSDAVVDSREDLQ